MARSAGGLREHPQADRRANSTGDPGVVTVQAGRAVLSSSVADVDLTATDQTRTAYSTIATTYDELVGDTSFEAPIDLAMIQHFLSQVGVDRGAHLLDAGCGAGRMLTYLEQLDPSLQLTGIDLAPGMVRQARRNHPTRRIDEAALAALPHDDAHFDGVLSWYSIIHTPAAELACVVSEFGRVLRPGGLLLLGFHAGSGQRIAQRAYGHDVALRIQLHDVHHMQDALTAGGFEVQVQLERGARPVEHNPQGFLLTTRV